jgi:hypothetical protein
MLRKIRSVFFDVIHDFWSCIYHAHDLLIDSSTKSVVIFFILVVLAFFATVFNSNNQAEFYINFLKIIFVSVVTYFIFCLSDYFWFLKNKFYLYDKCINNKKYMKIALKNAKTIDNLKADLDIKGQLWFTVFYYSNGWQRHAKRYLVEICVLLVILFNVAPIFFIYNLIIFAAMYLYVFFYEKQSAAQAFADIFLIINCIKKLNKENPGKCKSYILENKLVEIRELKILYQAILKG